MYILLYFAIYLTYYILFLFVCFKLVSLFFVIYLIIFFFDKLIQDFLQPIVRSTSFFWDDVLYDNKIFDSISFLMSLFFLKVSTRLVLYGYDVLITRLDKLYNVIFVLLCLQFLIRLINSVIDVFDNVDKHKSIVIRSCFQLLKIFFIFFFIIFIISILCGIQIASLLTGLGTLTAVIVLIFKDTILGFVSGMQIAAGKIIKKGDAVSVPKYNLEGKILEINLFSIKIENFNKSISVISAYNLINTIVINLETISKKKTRRMKYSILFNVKNFRFFNIKEVDFFLKEYLFTDFLKKNINIKKKIIHKYSNSYDIDKNYTTYITNIELFKYYVISYLHTHNHVLNKEVILLRNLKMTIKGLPVEMYCFIKSDTWKDYEMIKSNICDYVLTIVKEFDLSVVKKK